MLQKNLFFVCLCVGGFLSLFLPLVSVQAAPGTDGEEGFAYDLSTIQGQDALTTHLLEMSRVARTEAIEELKEEFRESQDPNISAYLAGLFFDANQIDSPKKALLYYDRAGQNGDKEVEEKIQEVLEGLASECRSYSTETIKVAQAQLAAIKEASFQSAVVIKALAGFFFNSKDGHKHLDVMATANYYYQLAQMGDEEAMQAYKDLYLAVKDISDTEARQIQGAKLADSYGMHATAEDVPFLKETATHFMNGYPENPLAAAKLYIKAVELGDPEARSQFHELLNNLDGTYSLEHVLKDLFLLCQLEIEKGDKDLEPILEKLYDDYYFLRAVFKHYEASLETDPNRRNSIAEMVLDLYRAHGKKAMISGEDIIPFIEVYKTKFDDGNIEAAHTIIEMSFGWHRNGSLTSTALEYAQKARNMDDTEAMPKFHKLFQDAKSFNRKDIAQAFPLLLKEIQEEDTILETIVDGHYSHDGFLDGAVLFHLNSEDPEVQAQGIALFEEKKSYLSAGQRRYRLENGLFPSVREYYVKKAEEGDSNYYLKAAEISYVDDCYIPCGIDYLLCAMKAGHPESRKMLIKFLDGARGYSDSLVNSLSKNSYEYLESLQDGELFCKIGHLYANARFYMHIREAAQYYFKAIACGYVDAKNYLDTPLKKIKKISSDSRKKYADEFARDIFPLYEKEAARDGQTDGLFYRTLACEYASGELLEKDTEKAKQYFVRAAVMDVPNINDFRNSLPDDMQSDVETMLLAHLNALPEEAKTASHFLLLAQLEVQENPEQAQEYCEKAKAKGGLDFHICMAKMYADGSVLMGGKISHVESLRYYLKAALEDETFVSKAWDAQYNVGQNGELIVAMEEVLDEEIALGNRHAFHMKGMTWRDNSGKAAEYLVGAARLGHPDSLEEALKCLNEARAKRSWGAASQIAAFNPLLDYLVELAGNGEQEHNRTIAGLALDLGKVDMATHFLTSEITRLVACAREGYKDEYAALVEYSMRCRSITHDFVKQAKTQKFHAIFLKPYFDFELERAEGGNIESIMQLAKMMEFPYKNGHGSGVDCVKVAECLLKISKDDDQYETAQKAFHALNPDDDVAQSRLFSLYLSQAERGVTQSQFVTGLKYQYGKGTPQDYDEAEKWYKATEKVNPRKSAKHLGILYQCRAEDSPEHEAEYNWKSFESYISIGYSSMVKNFLEGTIADKTEAYDQQKCLDTLCLNYRTFVGYTGSLVTDSEALQLTSLGRAMASVMDTQQMFKDVDLTTLSNLRPGFMLSQHAIVTPIPGFLESQSYLKKDYVSAGAENVQLSQKVTELLAAYHSTSEPLNMLMNSMETAIHANNAKILSLQARIYVDDEKAKEKVKILVEAQAVLEAQQEYLQAYKSAAEELETFVIKGAATRTQRFYEPENYGFIK